MHRLACGQESEQVVSKRVQLGQVNAVGTHKRVVSQHGRNSHGQTQTGHHQGFTHRAGDLVQGYAIGQTDIDQGVVHTPNRTEQTHKRSGRTHRSQQRQAIFQLGGFFVHDFTHDARDKGIGRAFLFQTHGAVFHMVFLSVDSVAG